MTGLAGTRSVALHPQAPSPGRPPGCVVTLQITKIGSLSSMVTGGLRVTEGTKRGQPPLKHHDSVY